MLGFESSSTVCKWKINHLLGIRTESGEVPNYVKLLQICIDILYLIKIE